MSFEVERSPDGTVVQILGGHRFEMPAISDLDLVSEPIQLFHSAGSFVGEAFKKLREIGGDDTLSTLGIELKTDPVKAEVVGRIAAAAGQVKNFENSIVAAENQLYALPSMDPGAAAIAIEDREIRDWWRSMNISQRAKMLEQVGGNPAEHQRLMISLLRAPAPLALLDHEVKYVSGVWKEAKRAADPDKAVRIEMDRALVETSRRGLACLAGIASVATKWKADKVLRTLIASPFETARQGYDIFGFTPTHVAGMRRSIEQERSAGR